MTDPFVDLQEQLAARIEQAAATAFPEATVTLDPTSLTTELPDRSLGDVAVPCFPLAKTLRRAPQQIATALAQALPADELVAAAQASGPYLNLALQRGAVAASCVKAIAQAPADYGRNLVDAPQRIMVEYSSPNTNKPLHLGHVRNNAIGMALGNLLEALGHTVLRCNLINDRGIHICKSMLAYEKFGQGETPESTGEKGDHFVGRYYVKFQQEADNNPALEEEAQAMLRRWEQGDADVVALWEKMNSWVYAGFNQSYEHYGCRFDVVYHESETYLLGKDIVEDGLQRGVFYRRDDGAVEIDLSAEKLDQPKAVLLRPDGTSVYVTQDLGTAVKKFTDHELDRSLYVTGSEQTNHFRVLFTLLRKLGYAYADGCEHYAYGMVYLPEGKMKSREGKVVDADDLLAQLQDSAAALIREKHPEMDAATLADRQRQVALAGIKYFILRVDPLRDIHFDPSAELKFQGNTGPYLQYAHVRVASILRKAGLSFAAALDPAAPYERLDSEADFDLALALARYPSLVRSAGEALNPAQVAAYLYELARTFTRFYDASPVLDAEPGVREARLGLIAATAHVLRAGLDLLGIEAPESM